MIFANMKGVVPHRLKRRLHRFLVNLRDTASYRMVGKRPIGKLHHVIFVCKGNICRSAFAEHYLRQQLLHESVVIESCGLDVDQGLLSPPHAILAGLEFGVELNQHRSKGCGCCGFRCSDLILTMEYCQYLRLLGLFPEQRDKIRLLSDFAPPVSRLLCNIDDPYGGDFADFRRSFRELQRALDGLVNQVLQGSATDDSRVRSVGVGQGYEGT